MNGYTDKTKASSSEELLASMASPLPDENYLSQNLSQSQISSDSASSISMSSSGYERQLLTRLPSFMENKDHTKRNSLSPNGSLNSVHDANFLSDRVRCLESEKLTLMVDHNNLIKDFNKRMQSYLDEIRTLKEVNQTAEQELNELRDLCCFLDDDRRKCRKLAKEWQKFGRNTVTTLKTEVEAYQQQQSNLEAKNSQLIQENFELRELCLHLDQQASSNNCETEPALKYTICTQCNDKSRTNSESSQHVSENIVALENRVQQLEREKDMLHRLLTYGTKSPYEKKRVSFTFPDDGCDSSSTASELDFPPSAINLDLLTKSIHLQDNLDTCSNDMSSLDINASEANGDVGVNGPVYDQRSPVSHPMSKNEKLNLLLKNRKCEPNITVNTKLPAYEDSVRYLEASRTNMSKINNFADNSIPSESDVL